MHEATEFLRASGRQLTLGESEVRLRGIVYGFAQTLPTRAEYCDIAAMNMNVVRLPLSYAFFYDRADPTVSTVYASKQAEVEPSGSKTWSGCSRRRS
jgi:hypothetical protein